ncbi:hypothetical protein [Streptomyces sp. URMC 123]|uniref:hypothetical protein n=1 Tax=Streptomyces sp. URMC 123 TaxID=3423403 RepID=UPI003F1CCA68
MTGIQETTGHGGHRRAVRHQGKTAFDDVYDRPDPRAYFRRLRPLAYRTPHHAQPVFRRLLAAHQEVTGAAGPPTVLDICCSYGVNAALINHELSLEELYARYTAPERAGLTTDELIDADRAFYAGRRLPSAAPVLGLDAAGRAVAYAERAGLLDRGFGEDLESADPGEELTRALPRVGLITVTGGIGYVTERTFARLLPHMAHGPEGVWVAAFVLRSVSFEPIAETLDGFGLVTEKLPHTFAQRRFSDERERRAALAAVASAGLSPEGKEELGFHHCELFLARPGPVAAWRPADLYAM